MDLYESGALAEGLRQGLLSFVETKRERERANREDEKFRMQQSQLEDEKQNRELQRSLQAQKMQMDLADQQRDREFKNQQRYMGQLELLGKSAGLGGAKSTPEAFDIISTGLRSGPDSQRFAKMLGAQRPGLLSVQKEQNNVAPLQESELSEPAQRQPQQSGLLKPTSSLQQDIRNRLERSQGLMNKQAKGSIGQQAVDRVFAKDYNEWTGGGKATVDKNLNLLEETLSEIKKDPSVSGRFIGRVPDVFKPEKNIRLRDNVHRAAQGTLRATLGAQFTEKEGQRIMNQAYDERLSPEANVAKIEATINELKQMAALKDAKSKYFEDHGTLEGFRYGNVLNKQGLINSANADTVLVFPPGSNIARKIPRSELSNALQSGGTLAE